MRRRGVAALLWQLVRAQVMTELQYRTNVVMQMHQMAIAVGVSLAGIALVLGQVDHLNGWGLAHLLVLTGAFTAVGGLLRAIARPNLAALIFDIRTGSLDYVLLRPADAQLQVSVRRLEPWYLVDVVVGLAVSAWGASLLVHQVAFVDVILFATTLLVGFVIVYTFLFVLVSTAFWFVRVDDAIELFEAVYQAGRWPVYVYPDWLRLGLTFLVPISFALTVPAEALTGRITLAALSTELAVAVAFTAFSRWFFRVALRHYTGASA